MKIEDRDVFGLPEDLFGKDMCLDTNKEEGYANITECSLCGVEEVRQVTSESSGN